MGFNTMVSAYACLELSPMNTIQVACPHCKRTYEAPAFVAGRQAKCIGCLKPFKVDLPKVDEPPPPPPPKEDFFQGMEVKSEYPADTAPPGKFAPLKAMALAVADLLVPDPVPPPVKPRRRARSGPVVVNVNVKPESRGGSAAMVIELFATSFSFGFLGGMGQVVAGKGPASLAVSLVCCFFLAAFTAATLGLGVFFWAGFVGVKLIVDLVLAAS